MTRFTPQQFTELLEAWGQGNQSALEQLIPVVYAELHRLAHHYMRQERPDHPLQTTALINEAYLGLLRSQNVHWQSRAHFLAIAAQLMRRVLVDYSRARHSIRAGGEVQMISLDEVLELSEKRSASLDALDEALNTLAAFAPRQSRVVELRFFGGLNVEEIASVLKVSPETVMRDWKMAKVWLYRELGGMAEREAGSNVFPEQETKVKSTSG